MGVGTFVSLSPDCAKQKCSWGCIGIKFADLAREQHVPTATLADVLTGQYIEAAVRNLSRMNIPFCSK